METKDVIPYALSLLSFILLIHNSSMSIIKNDDDKKELRTTRITGCIWTITAISWGIESWPYICPVVRRILGGI